jgi:hypothetical protein
MSMASSKGSTISKPDSPYDNIPFHIPSDGTSYETSPVLTSVGAASRHDIHLRSRMEAALTRKEFHFRLNQSTTDGLAYN